MKLHTADWKNYRWELSLALGMMVAFIYLLMRNIGLYPAVFADEMLYSAYSRLAPLGEAGIPSYLYLAAFRATNACGDRFLDCARVLNIAFFVGAAPFIYLSARQVCGKALALAVSVLCLAAPINSYTAYFMPEAMYFFAFFVLTWVALSRTAMHWAGYALLTGTILGLMTLVKVHALFLIPALGLFTVFVSWTRHRQGSWLRIGLAAALLSAGAALATKFAISYAFAGSDGLHLFGSFYGPQASSSASGSLLKLLAPAFINARGHLAGLAVLFGLPIALLARSLLSGAARAEAGDKLCAVQLYALLMLGAALAMTIMYTASIADFGPREVLRLHMRYYDFAFPLLLIVAAAALGAPQSNARPALTWAIAIALAAAMPLAVHRLPTYLLSMIDGPELASLMFDTNYGRAMVALQLLILVLWALGRRLSAQLFIFVFLPLLMASSGMAVEAFMRHVEQPGPFDKAGLFAHRYVKPDEHKDMAIAGTGLAELMRAKFHVDQRDVALFEMAENAPYDLDHLPARKKWLLVVGKHALPPELEPVVATDDFALVRLALSHRPIGAEDFTKAPTGELLEGMDGAAEFSAWGRWSTGKLVTLRFRQALPARLNLILKAQAYGPNADQQFILRAGQAEKRFHVPATVQEVFLRLDTDGTQKTITIEVPQPVSPLELGRSVDPRKLGISLFELEIGSPDN